jgi:hypothetical protein
LSDEWLMPVPKSAEADIGYFIAVALAAWTTVDAHKAVPQPTPALFVDTAEVMGYTSRRR